MKFSLDVALVLTAAAALLSLGGVALWALAKSSRLLPPAKWIVGLIVVVVVAAVSAWLVFILPAYLD